MEPTQPSNRRPSRLPRRTSRRALLRTGLAASPVLLVGVWAGPRIFRRAGRAHFAAAQTPACVVTPQLTEGPYFVDEKLYRSDIRAEPTTGEVKDGVPLRLAFRVSDVTGGSCAPLAGAA